MAEEIAELIARLRLQDETVAGLNAARDRMEKAATSAEKLEAELRTVGSASETVDVKARAAGKSIDAIERSISGTATATSMANRVLKEHADAVEKVRIRHQQEGKTAEETAAAIARLDMVRDQGLAKAREAGARVEAQFGATTAATQKYGNAAATAANQTRMMAYQIQDVVASLGSGSPPLQVFLQQGGQIAAIYGGAGAAIRGVVNILGGPWVLGFVAATAVMATFVARAASFSSEQRNLSVALQAVGKDASVASQQLAEYTRQLERSGTSRADARAAALQLARNPALDTQRTGQLIGLAPDFAAAMGISATDALKQLSEVATGTYADIVKLSDSMNLLTASTRQNIVQLIQQGKSGEAVDAVFKALGDRIKGMHENSMSPMEKALLNLANNWSAFMDRIANSGPVIQALKLLSEAVQGLDDMSRRVGGGPAAQPGDAQEDRIASLVMGRDRLVARYTMLNNLRPGNPARMEIAQLEERIGKVNEEIAALRQQVNVARGNPGALPGMGNPLPDSIGPAATVSPDNLATQWAKMEDLTRSYKRQNEVLSASVPTRAAVEARIAAENDLLTNGLKGLAAQEYVRRKVAEATAAQADAAGQSFAALTREAQAALAVVSASERGRAEMLRASAAAEAHEQAATRATVGESKLAQAILNRGAAQEAAKGASNLLELNDRIGSLERLIQAEGGGASASYWAALDEKINDATKSLKAYAEATSDPGLRAILETLIKKTEERMKKEAALNEQLALRKEMTQGNQELELLRRQIELTGVSAEVRERELAALRAIQEIERRGGDRNNLTPDQANYVQMRRDIADANTALRQHEALYNEIANSATQAFDQVGQAIVNAFISGEGAAVNFNNVFKGVMAAILNQLVRFSVINPVLNSIGLGGDKPTLLGGLGTGAATKFFDTGGLLGGAGMFSKAKEFLFGSTQTLGPGDTTSIGGLFSGTMIGDAFKGLSDLLPSMSDISSMFAGFGIGSALGSLVANGRQSGQQNAMIGAGIGSLALGPLGGLLGGLVGGLFGPENSVQGYGFRLQSSGWDSGNAMGDALNPISRQFYNDSGKQAFAQADALVKATNKYLQENSLQVGGVSIVGGNKNGADYSWADSGTLEEAFTKLRFRSKDNQQLSDSLAGKTFESLDELSQWVSGFKSAQDAMASIANAALPKFTQSVNAINDSFNKAAETARKYGLSEAALTAERERQLAALEAERAETLRASEASLAVRRLAAGGQTEQAELARQAEAARQELNAFGKQLDDLAVAAAEKSRLLVDLEAVQAAERAQIIKKYAEEAKTALQQQIDNLIAAGKNIRQYLDSLSSSAAYGASPEDRVSSARAAFIRDRDLAAGGDIDAANRVTNSADAYLQAARDYFASGSGYQAALEQVKTGLANIPAVQTVDEQMAETLAAIRENLQLTGEQTLTVLQIQAGSATQVVEHVRYTNAILELQSKIMVDSAANLMGAIDVSNRIASGGWTFNGTQLAYINESIFYTRADMITGQAATNTILASINASIASADTNTVNSFVAANTILASINASIASAHTGLLAGINATNTILGTPANDNDAIYLTSIDRSIGLLNTNQTASIGATNTIFADGMRSITTSIAATNTLIANMHNGLQQQTNMQVAAFREMTSKLSEISSKLDDMARSLSRLKQAA